MTKEAHKGGMKKSWDVVKLMTKCQCDIRDYKTV